MSQNVYWYLQYVRKYQHKRVVMLESYINRYELPLLNGACDQTKTYSHRVLLVVRANSMLKDTALEVE